MNSVSAPDVLKSAREALSGKRVALVGFDDASAVELTEIITDADAFARSLSIKTSPSADLFRPFELILINIESAADTDWIESGELSHISDKCVAVGRPAVLLTIVSAPQSPYREFCVWPALPEVLLLRCVIALRPGSHAGPQALPSGSTVVIADDDPSITGLVRLLLQRNGLTCEVASNGGDALELINRVRPCAAVLDIGMPNIDGFEVLSRIRNVPETAQTRVILLTGLEQEADILRGFRLGADDYVTKPFNPMELMVRLKRLIGRLQ